MYLSSRVNHELWNWHVGSNGRQVDNNPTALLLHLRQHNACHLNTHTTCVRKKKRSGYEFINKKVIVLNFDPNIKSRISNHENTYLKTTVALIILLKKQQTTNNKLHHPNLCSNTPFSFYAAYILYNAQVINFS